MTPASKRETKSKHRENRREDKTEERRTRRRTKGREREIRNVCFKNRGKMDLSSE